MKLQKTLLLVFSVISPFLLACEEDNIVDNIITTPNVSIGQTSGDTLGIAITGSNSEAANQTTAISFTKDTILVSYAVTAYGGGEAFITPSNAAMESKTFDLNSNKSIGQEPLNFKPTSVNVNIKSGYTGVVAMAVIGK
jgi:hypothetical protein